MWISFALAVQLVTGHATLSTEAPTRQDARRAVAFFPLIGTVVGILLAAVWTLASRVWSGQPLIAAALVLASGVLAMGARPLDGIARAADGLAAESRGGDRSRAFAAMRDPRRGTMGMIGLVVILALKLGFLSALGAGDGGLIVIVASVIGRWATAFSFAAFPLASASSLDADTHAGLADAGPNEFLIATALAFAGAALLPTRGLLTLLAAALIVGPVAQAVNRRLGGLNAPVCQALGELGEVAALACLTIH